MDDEESKEFETRLLHLGQDIGYMGLRVQKDVQKYIKDLKTTHDCKKFCSKLALALKRFSTYTEQYAKDLEDRINTFNKEDEYEEVKSTLKTIICSNSLGPPNNNSGDETKEPLDNDVKNEVLSQQSLHIGIDNEPKDEPLTQPQSLSNENQNVSSGNLTDLPEEGIDNEPKDEPLTQPQSLNSENQNVSSSNLTDLPEEGSQAGDRVAEDGDEDMATQDLFSSDIPQNLAVPEAADTTMENNEHDMATQESIVFDMETEQENAEASAEGLVASPEDNDETILKGEDPKDGDTGSISEFSSCASDAIGEISETDNQNEEIKRSKSKKKIKDKDRKSLLKVIAEYFMKKKLEKAKTETKSSTEKCDNVNESKEDSKKKDTNKKHDKKSSGKRRKHDKSRVVKSDNNSGTDDKPDKTKEKPVNKRVDKEAKKYIDYLNSSKIDESSKSSDEFAKDNMDIQEDISDSSDIDATQIEDFNTANDKENSANVQQGSSKETKNHTSIGSDKSGNADSDDSEDFFSSPKKVAGNASEVPGSSESKEPVQTFTDFIDQLPLPARKEDKNEHVDDLAAISNEDPDLTQKVDDIRTLKHLSANSIQEISGNIVAQLPKDDEDQNVSQVVSPFKKKAVLPLKDSSSEDEKEDDSQVVSPFKKNCVKRLHSSGESDSEPPKKSLDFGDNNESDSDIVRPFKRRGLKRLSTDVENEPTQESSGVDEPEIKRKKNTSQSNFEFDNSDLNGVEELDMDQNDGEIVEEEVVYNFEPSQFTLDDHARDDFLELLNQRVSGTVETGSPGVRDEDVDNQGGNANIEPSQFKLDDCDRDNLFNLLTDKENDKRSEEVDIEPSQGGEDLLSLENKEGDIVSKENDKKSDDNKVELQEGVTNVSVVEENHENIDDEIEPSQFRLDNSARDDLLALFDNGEGTSDKQNVKKEVDDQATNSSEKDDISKENSVESDGNDFQLNKEARDAFFDLLNGKQSDESRGDEAEIPDSLNGRGENSRQNSDEPDNEDIAPSQFKLSTEARDELLHLFGDDSDSNEKGASNETDDSGDSNSKIDEKKNLEADNETEQHLDMAKRSDTDSEKNGDSGEAQSTSSKEPNDEAEVDDNDNDDTATENSQGIDDNMDDLDDRSNVGEVDDKEEKIDDENETTAKSSAYKLDDVERDELLKMLTDHIKQKEGGSGSDGSESDSDVGSNKESDCEDDNGGPSKKRRKKSKNIDNATLLELLEEYENAVAGKEEELFENVKKGGEKHGRVGMDSAAFSDSDNAEDSGGDSDSILLDLLKEEAADQASDGQKNSSPQKRRNTNKEAWMAYQSLLKDSDDISDSSSEVSDIDIDNFEFDFSDQERRQKEKNAHDKLRKQFGIRKELFVDIIEADISGYDLPATTKETKGGSNFDSLLGDPMEIDRLCDISNVLQKRKPRQKKQRHRRKPQPIPSDSSSSGSSSDSDNNSWSSSASYWSDDSRRSRRSSGSSRGSAFQNFSDHEQAKLASALWDNIRNSSDENDRWSSYGGSSSSSDEEEENKKRKKDLSEGGKRKKKKKESESEKEKEESGEESESQKSDSDGDESGNDKKAYLDSSDEDDFVGVRKNRGSWKSDPLLRSCSTSEEDSDSDADQKKKKLRSRKKGKSIVLGSDNSDTSSDVDVVGKKTPIEKTGSDDSDVEFVMEKKKTPKKKGSVLDEKEEVDDNSPSKKGKGRRNIRELLEDDELADATKQAKKKENERIKRLQEREKALESFTQSQSFGSQLTEDDDNPLILDANEEVLIKVHPKISNKLKPHQRTGIQFMWDSCYESVEQLQKGYEGSGCILAHCMGLGKTLQALGLIHTVFTYKVTKTKHVLVVCPLSTVANWRNEWKLAFKQIRNFKTELYTIQDKKGASNRFQIVNRWRRNGGVLIMGYECFGNLTNEQKLNRWEEQGVGNKEDILKALVKPGPDLVICDEGHLLRNKQSQRTLALNKVSTKRRIVLTGTPLQNNLLEYYYMVNFVKPSLLGTEKEFKTNFVNPIVNGQFEDSTATDILFMKKRTHVLHKILAKTVQRVEDTELKQYLPALIDQALFVKLSDLQVKFYNTFLDHANARPAVYTASGNISRKNFLSDIQILRYICTHPDTVTIAKSSGKSKIKEQDVIDDDDDVIEDKVFSKAEWFKDLVPESGMKETELGTKMMVALAIVEEAAVHNEKVLIFSQTYAEMDSLEYFLKQKFAYKKGVDYNRMDGTISPEIRTQMCDKFNDKKNKRLRVFIMSTKVGGLGLNLTAASRIILMNVNWNPSYDTQSVFRAFRFGQEKTVYVYRLIAMNTMEEKMYQRQVTKLAVAHRVVDKHQITRHYSAADIQEFYSARPTTEGERPLPNVPEDRILAKLIQKFQFLFKWHEHQALLANRPEEDLNEQQKNAAWEEFNKKAVEPPPPVPDIPTYTQFMNASDILNRPGTSAIYGGRIPYPPGIYSSAGGLYADHNYSLPKTNPLNFRWCSSDDFHPMPPKFPSVPRPLFVDVDAPLRPNPPPLVLNKHRYKVSKRPNVAQRTTSADDFRTTTQSKYVPRPIFVDVTAPLGPRPNLGGTNPLAAKKSQSAVSRTAQNQPANVASKPAHQPTSITPTQVRLGSAITLTPNNGQKNPPPAHNQKPSMTIIPHTSSSKSLSANVMKPPHFVPKHINMVQNPLNLVKNVQQPGRVQPNIAKNGAQVSQNQPKKGTVQSRQEKSFNQNISTLKTTSTALHKAGTSPQVSKNPSTVRANHQRPVTNPPLVQIAPKPTASAPQIRPVPTVSLLTTPVTPTSDPLYVPTPTTSTASTQQSPLQKQMRQFMEHLHRLQNTLQKDQDVVGSSTGAAWNTSGGSQGTSNNNPVGRNNNTFGSNNKVGEAAITPNFVSGPTVVKPTNVRLNAARDLSDITKKYQYQRTPDNKVVGVLIPPATSTSQSSPTQVTANGQRVVGPPNSFGNNLRTYGKGISSKPDGKAVRINPLGPVRRVITNVGHPKTATAVSVNNGRRVSTNGVSTTTPPAVAKLMPVGSNVARLVSVSPGAKKVLISPKSAAQQNGGIVQNQRSSVRVVTPKTAGNDLQQKMATNLSKLTRIPPKNLPAAPQRSFNNGTSVKTYQAKKNNPPSRTNSLPSISLNPSTSVSKSNKENRTRRRFLMRQNNPVSSSIDLSKDDDNGSTSSSGSLSQDMVNTLKKKGVSINYLKKDVINLD